MTLAEIRERANKGFLPYKEFGQVKIIVTESESFPGDHYLNVILKAHNPYCTDAMFGGGFLEYATEEDAERLDQAFTVAVSKMKKAEYLAGLDPLPLQRVDKESCEVHYHADGFSRKLNYEEASTVEDMFFLYVLYGGENDYAFGKPVILDGKVYKPIYSFWLGHPYYSRKTPMGLLPSEEQKNDVGGVN